MVKPERQQLLLPLLIAGMIVLAVLMAALSSERTESEPFANRSAHSSSSEGYKAWYLANRKAGLPLSVWERPFEDLHTLPAPATMLIVEPYTVARTEIIFGQQEIESLMDWVSQGNTLVLLDDFKRYGSARLLRQLHLRITTDPRPAPFTLAHRIRLPYWAAISTNRC
jgi:hypothetical protein